MKHLLLFVLLLGSTLLLSQNLILTSVDVEPERCGRNDGSFSISHDGIAPFTYFLNAVAIPGPTVSGLDQGMYAFRVVDAAGRSKDTIITIIEIPAPIITWLDTTPATCSVGGTALINSSDPTATATWNSIPQQTGFRLMDVPAGNYTVTVVDSVGCSSNLQVTVIGIPPPDLKFEMTPDTCGAGNGTATVNITGNGTAPFTYRWNNNGTTSTISNLPTGDYEVEVMDTNGCRATGRIRVLLFSNLTLTADITRTSCFAGDDGRIAVSVAGGNGQYSYTWSPDVGNEAVVENLEAGQYTVTVQDLQGQGGQCIAIETFTVDQPRQIKANIRVEDATGCRLPDGKMYVSPEFTQGPYVVTWDTLFSPGNGFVPLIGDTAKGVLPGLYSIEIVDSAGCEIKTRVVLPNQDNIDLKIEILAEDKCGLGEGVVNAIVTGGTRPIRYNWFTFPSQGVFEPFAKGLPRGTFSVVVSDDKGCVAQQGFTMPGNDPLAVDTIITTPNYCELNNGTARVRFTGGQVPYRYNWTTSPVQRDAFADNLDGGTYQVSLRDTNNCLDTAIVFVRDSAGFTLDAEASDETCYRRSDGVARARTSGANGNVNFAWSTDPPSFGANQRGLAPRSYQVIATDARGCERSTVVNVGEAFPLLADFTFSPDTMRPVLIGETEFSFRERSIGAASFFWQFGDGQTSNAANPVHAYRDTGSYDVTLRVQDESGACQDDITFGPFLVKDQPKVWIPTAFSPNADAFNDRLTFFALNLQSFNMQIFNRWGMLVFETNNPNTFWDGNIASGGSAPEGVYVYLLKAISPDGGRIEQTGSITLVR
ncbi:MAG: gliding motility-associated C-terminal domain-containing protein [Bacteroidia bacterium]